MVAISPITFALPLLILLSCLAGGSDAAGAAVLQKLNCSTAGNYTATDAYTANLKQLLADIPDTTVSKNGGFFNGSVGGQPGAPGTAYGLALCAADFTRSDCHDCLASATGNSSGLLKQCPGSSTVFAMYDQCLVHYSDAAFVGTAYTDIVYTSHGETSLGTLVHKEYSDALKQGLSYLSAQAANSTQRFAMSQASPFALAQCTWDMPSDGCKTCIDLLAANVSDFMTVTTTGVASTYSCRVRHSNDSFAVFPFEAISAVPLSNNTGGGFGITAGGSSKRTVIAAAVSVSAAVAILLGVSVAVWCRRGRRARRNGSITMGDASVHIDLVQDYTYDELKKATRNFSKDSELGRGAFGVVYKGTLDNGKVIAVKKVQRTEKVDATQFMNEVSILSGLKHKNLVKLEGYCVHNQEGLLCYEYLPDGTLEDRLYGRGPQQHAAKPKLSWRERHYILVGICRGLQYLHDESPNDISIMHMDLKTDNILLQEDKAKKNLTPKISDFGISRNLDNDKQHEYVNQVVGNVSCVPREFIERGKASPKVDIYSFGLIILEVVTGKPRSSWSSTTEEKRYSEGFIKQVREHWEKKDVINKLKDSSMDNDCHDEIEKCIELALECVQEDPATRPDIATVMRRITDIGHYKKQEKP